MNKNQLYFIGAGLLIIFLFFGNDDPQQVYNQSIQSMEKSIANNILRVEESVNELPIVDGSLKACIADHAKERARIPSTNSGSIRDVKELKLMSCSRRGILSIQGIGSLPNLKNLNLRGNKITDISPIAGHPSLEGLFISDNPIESLSPLAKVRNLRHAELPRMPELMCDDIREMLAGIRYTESFTRCQKSRATSEKSSKPIRRKLNASEERELLDYEMGQ